jgi:hypothetical protein
LRLINRTAARWQISLESNFFSAQNFVEFLELRLNLNSRVYALNSISAGSQQGILERDKYEQSISSWDVEGCEQHERLDPDRD